MPVAMTADYTGDEAKFSSGFKICTCYGMSIIYSQSEELLKLHELEICPGLEGQTLIVTF